MEIEKFISYITLIYQRNIFLNENNAFCLFNNITEESFKNLILEQLKFFKLDYREIGKDLIEIIFKDSTYNILLPISLVGIIKLITLQNNFNFYFYTIQIYNIFNRSYLIPIILIGNLKKKLPLSQEEFYSFFKDIRQITDKFYIDNFSLEDIYYDELFKQYVIIDIKSIISKPYFIEVRLDQLFHNKTVYYYNDSPINLDEINLLLANGGII